jgi:hypothetical protein
MEGLDPGKLEEAGWGVIFHARRTLRPCARPSLRCWTSGGPKPVNGRNAFPRIREAMPEDLIQAVLAARRSG